MIVLIGSGLFLAFLVYLLLLFVLAARKETAKRAVLIPGLRWFIFAHIRVPLGLFLLLAPAPAELFFGQLMGKTITWTHPAVLWPRIAGVVLLLAGAIIASLHHRRVLSKIVERDGGACPRCLYPLPTAEAVTCPECGEHYASGELRRRWSEAGVLRSVQ